MLDESHRAKGRGFTKIGQMIMRLQWSLPLARFVYVSATAASTPQELSYMTRLGIWGPGTQFNDVTDFTEQMEQRYEIVVPCKL